MTEPNRQDPAEFDPYSVEADDRSIEAAVKIADEQLNKDFQTWIGSLRFRATYVQTMLTALAYAAGAQRGPVSAKKAQGPKAKGRPVWFHDDCTLCGDAVIAVSTATQDGYFFEDDKAVCIGCGARSSVRIDDVADDAVAHVDMDHGGPTTDEAMDIVKRLVATLWSQRGEVWGDSVIDGAVLLHVDAEILRYASHLADAVGFKATDVLGELPAAETPPHFAPEPPPEIAPETRAAAEVRTELDGFKVGDRVRYHPNVYASQHDGSLYVIAALDDLGHGENVAWLHGKSGCVPLKCLSHYEQP